MVAYQSGATNMVSGDTNGVRDVFLHDMVMGETMRTSVSTAGAQGDGVSHYTAATGTLTIPAGSTSGTVNGDTLYEADETFTVTLSGPVNATITTAVGTGTITKDDLPPTLAINDVSQAEGNAGTTNYVFTVTQSAVSGLTTTVTYATADGTATAGSDYTAIAPTTLTIPAGNTTGTITVSVTGDTTTEANETFVVNLSAPTNATISDNQGLATIVNDDVVVTERIGVQGDGASQGFPSVSADGRYVTFSSSASNLVVGDTNGVADIFVVDRQTGATQRVSVDSGGVQGNGDSRNPVLSADASAVAFMSESSTWYRGIRTALWMSSCACGKGTRPEDVSVAFEIADRAVVPD